MVRWPARRVAGGTSCPSARGCAGGSSGAETVPAVGGVRGSAGRPGSGAACPIPVSLPPPNNALEPTAPSGSFFPCGCWYVGAAAHRGRSVARAAGGRRGAVPLSAGVCGWRNRHGSRASCRRSAGLRRGALGAGRCGQDECAPPTEPRTGADGPQWASVAGVGLSMWPAAHRQRSAALSIGSKKEETTDETSTISCRCTE